MTAAGAAFPSWSRRRWAMTIGVAIAIQAGMILWLGDHPGDAPRTTGRAFQVSLSTGPSGELGELYNPTLFVWPGPHGFSGAARRQPLPLELANSSWTEPPRFLRLSAADFGSVVRQLVRSNTRAPFQVAFKALPEMTLPPLPAPTALFPTQSVVRVEGELKGRRLVSGFALTNWPHDNLLPDTIVQVAVSPDGWVESATMLPGSSSGYPAADQSALDWAKSARFESLRDSGPDRPTRKLPELTWGELVFSWNTVPLPVTNSPLVR